MCDEVFLLEVKRLWYLREKIETCIHRSIGRVLVADEMGVKRGFER